MSYGKYLTEDEKKIQEGAATPPTATAPSAPMSYEQFVGTGTGSQNYQSGVGVLKNEHDTSVGLAEQNKQAGYDYATGIKNSAYKSAEAATAESNRLAEKQYQRSVIDSRSSYQKAVGVYGSDAETLASNGLGGSGYGEWLQGNAYATHRGEVQNAGAQRLAIQNDAAYKEQQAKHAADQSYGQFLYQTDTAYNTEIANAKNKFNQGMYQLGLGLSEEQNATYSALYNSAASGATIDSIMQDGRWGDLTPDQQEAIKAMAKTYADKTAADEQSNQNAINDTNFGNWVTSISNGSVTLDQVKAISGYENLTDDQKTQLEAAYNTAVSNKQDEELKNATEVNDANYDSFLGAIKKGSYTLADVQAMSGYNNLTAEQKVQLENAAEQAAAKVSAKEREDLAGRIIDYAAMLESGMSLEEVKEIMDMYDDAYDGLGVTMKAVLTSAANRYTSSQEELKAIEESAAADDRRGQILGLAALAGEGYSEEDINKYIALYGITELSDTERAVIKAECDRYTAAMEKVESERVADQVYGLADLAASGYTLDEIKNVLEAKGGDYDSLSDAQKAVINDAINRYTTTQKAIESENELERAYGYASLIEAGWTLDEVKALIGEDAYSELDDESKRIIEGTNNVINRINAEEEAAISAAELKEQGIINDQNYLNWLGAIRNGEISIDELKELGSYEGLSGTQKQMLEGAYDRYVKATAESLIDYDSYDEVESFLESSGVAESEKQEIITSWQEKNANDFDSILKDAKFENGQLVVGGEPLTGADLYADIKHGVYGDNAESVIKSYVGTILSSVENCTFAEAVWAKKQLSDLANAWWEDDGDTAKISNLITTRISSIPNVFGVKSFKTEGTFKNGPVPTEIEGVSVTFKEYENDESIKAELERLGGSNTNALVYYNGNYYFNNRTDLGGRKMWARIKVNSSGSAGSSGSTGSSGATR